MDLPPSGGVLNPVRSGCPLPRLRLGCTALAQGERSSEETERQADQVDQRYGAPFRSGWVNESQMERSSGTPGLFAVSFVIDAAEEGCAIGA